MQRSLGSRSEIFALVLMLALAACSRGSETASTNAVGRHPDSEAAIHRCEAGIRAGHAAGVGDMAAVTMAECRFLYAKPACRDAWEASPGIGTATRVVRACRDAYCGDLPVPKPRLCGVLPADDQALRSAWPELNDAILELDHGDVAGWKREFFTRYARLQRLMIVGVGVQLPPT
jgi:hypothetical protein